MLGKVFRFGCAAIVFVTIAGLLAILFLMPSYGQTLAWWMPIVFIACMWPLIAGIKLVFFALKTASSTSKTTEELEAEGLVETQSYRAVRAFSVEEFEDEGSHYFLELEDGSVLYLTGQELYSYEPIDDDPELNQARQFPCTEFILRKHKTEGYIIDIQCGGTVLEPEVVAPPFSTEDFEDDRAPEPNSIIHHRTFDQIKAERLALSQENHQ